MRPGRCGSRRLSHQSRGAAGIATRYCHAGSGTLAARNPRGSGVCVWGGGGVEEAPRNRARKLRGGGGQGATSPPSPRPTRAAVPLRRSTSPAVCAGTISRSHVWSPAALAAALAPRARQRNGRRRSGGGSGGGGGGDEAPYAAAAANSGGGALASAMAAYQEYALVPESLDGVIVVGTQPPTVDHPCWDDGDLTAFVGRLWATGKPLAAFGTAVLALARMPAAAAGGGGGGGEGRGGTRRGGAGRGHRSSSQPCARPPAPAHTPESHTQATMRRQGQGALLACPSQVAAATCTGAVCCCSAAASLEVPAYTV
jgi:hypothetical protein